MPWWMTSQMTRGIPRAAEEEEPRVKGIEGPAVVDLAVAVVAAVEAEVLKRKKAGGAVTAAGDLHAQEAAAAAAAAVRGRKAFQPVGVEVTVAEEAPEVETPAV